MPLVSKPNDKCPQWSDARYWQFIRSALRGAWTRYPIKYEALKAVRVENPENRSRWLYPCCACGNLFKSKEVQVDHVVSAGSLKSYEDLPKFVETLFCGADNLQVMCKPCHLAKTKEDRRKRKEEILGNS